ncbi:MAG TPA: multiprotein-bridging factor 1 family protein [Candidatus Nanoarchaeia archaeon]|nr:multiprotein-bridging factor 1 family protein [Candidatus Nanoarchaeia archaeon]
MSSCDLCGREAELHRAEIEGVELSVCSSCVRHGKQKAPVPQSFVPRKQHIAREAPVERLVENFSCLLRRSREARQMTQNDFAAFLQERSSTVAKWESGALQPDIAVARKLERKLGVSLVEKEESVSAVLEKKRAAKDELTLGDFLKVKRKV